MAESRNALRDLVCACGVTYQGSVMRRYCDECRAIRRRSHSRAKNATRLGRKSLREQVDIGELTREWGGNCYLCEKVIDLALPWPEPMMATFDHLVPISLGGTDDRRNLRSVHLVCNIRKGNKVLGGDLDALVRSIYGEVVA